MLTQKMKMRLLTLAVVAALAVPMIVKLVGFLAAFNTLAS